jgi:hypothetical protein
LDNSLDVQLRLLMADEIHLSRAKLTQKLLRERRNEIRFPTKLSVRCRSEGPPIATEFAGVIRDVSTKGLGLILENALPCSSVLTVLGPDNSPLLGAQISVVFARPDAAGWLHGCLFAKMLTAAELALLLHTD